MPVSADTPGMRDRLRHHVLTMFLTLALIAGGGIALASVGADVPTETAAACPTDTATPTETAVPVATRGDAEDPTGDDQGDDEQGEDEQSCDDEATEDDQGED